MSAQNGSSQKWMVMIPQRRGNFAGVGIITVEMMDMSTSMTKAQIKFWTNLGPAEILSELGG